MGLPLGLLSLECGVYPRITLVGKRMDPRLPAIPLSQFSHGLLFAMTLPNFPNFAHEVSNHPVDSFAATDSVF